MDDTELLAAIGRMVVNASELEYAIAELVAVAEGLRDEKCTKRATAIVAITGEGRRLFRSLAKGRADLQWLEGQTALMLNARNFVAHSIRQGDGIAKEQPTLFVLNPRQGETMITTAMALNNARMIREGCEWVRDAIDVEISGVRAVQRPRYWRGRERY